MGISADPKLFASEVHSGNDFYNIHIVGLFILLLPRRCGWLMVWQSNDSDSNGYLKPLIQYALLNN